MNGLTLRELLQIITAEKKSQMEIDAATELLRAVYYMRGQTKDEPRDPRVVLAELRSRRETGV